MRQLTVALFGKALVDWGGGVDFLRNCANALLLQQSFPVVRPVLLLPRETCQARIRSYLQPLKGLAKDALGLRMPRFYWERPISIQSVKESFLNLNGDLLIVEYDDSTSGLQKALKATGADVILPVAETLGQTFDIPWVGYVPDVQHRYLPQHFTPVGRYLRDKKIIRLMNESKAVIVNSRIAADDLHKFYNPTGCKIFTLPFAPLPVEDWFVDRWDECQKKYNLPEAYFLISNQFWVHKSHSTAFYALAEISSLNEVHLVCTGRPGDPRAPDHYDKLLRILRENSLESRVHLLGYISKNDQIQIMKKAIAVIQPTLFEGGPGGGAVYDAVALGVPAIVSDIPVNLEINDDGIIFFAAGSASDLAAKMMKMLNGEPRIPIPANCLRQKGIICAERLASKLVEVTEYVVNYSRTSI